uniref:Putative ixodes 10 kDa peptide protein n=1 Tax=Ixodes ricinus TaxID=34613 RepID=A0A0K8RCB4_IXORI
MQLVLFVVVLILPAFQSVGFLFASSAPDDCVQLIIGGGNIKCRLGQFDYFEDYDPHTCELKCKGGRLPMPKVCSGSKVTCTPSVRTTLFDWKQDLEKTKAKLINEWCRGSQGK